MYLTAWSYLAAWSTSHPRRRIQAAWLVPYPSHDSGSFGLCRRPHPSHPRRRICSGATPCHTPWHVIHRAMHHADRPHTRRTLMEDGCAPGQQVMAWRWWRVRAVNICVSIYTYIYVMALAGDTAADRPATCMGACVPCTYVYI